MVLFFKIEIPEVALSQNFRKTNNIIQSRVIHIICSYNSKKKMPGKRKLSSGTPSRATGHKKQKKTSPVTKRRGVRVPPHVIADRQANATETESSLAESSDNESEVEYCTFPQISHHTTVHNFRISQNTIYFAPTQKTSIHDTVEEHVPHEIKKEIWDGTFIELSTLQKSQREMKGTEGDLKCKKGRLCIEKRSSGVELSINDWTSLSWCT